MTSIYEFYLQASFGWDENKKDGKGGEENRDESTVFPCLFQERKQEGKKTMKKKITLGPQIYRGCLVGLFGRVF